MAKFTMPHPERMRLLQSLGRSCTRVDDAVVPCGRAIAQQIKGTLGITGLSPPSVHSGEAVWHLDVGSSHPGAVGGPKGSVDRAIKVVREQ